VKKEDGRRELPVRGADGKFDIDGKLEIATREDVMRMVSSAIPLLRAGGQCRKLILTPGCRYRLAMSNQRSFKIGIFRFAAFVLKKIEYKRF
jgi:hypothetical protein